MKQTTIVSYSIVDACHALGIGRTTLYKLISQGRVRARKIGARTVVLSEDVQRLVADAPPADIKMRSDK